MPQTPVSANVFVNSATPLTIYTAPAGRTAIVNNVQVASLLGSTFAMTLNKVSASGVVYPIAVNRASGDDVNFFTGNGTFGNAPMNALKGSITLAANESISISTTTTPAFKFPRTTTGNGIINQVTYTNGRYVAVGRNGDTSRGLVLTSTDGQNWTSQPFAVTATLLDVAGNNSTRLIAISSTLSNGFFSSNDNGVTWTQLNNLTGGHSGSPVSVKFVNNLWIIVGPNYFYTSADGTAWTLNAAFGTFIGVSNPALNNVAHDGTRYIFTCRNTTPIYSTDLTTFFNTGSLRFGSQPSGIGYYPAGNRFYACFSQGTGAEYLSSSTDGLNWSRVTGITTHPSGSTISIPTAAGGTSQNIIIQSSNFMYGFVSTNGGTSWSSYDRSSQWGGGGYTVLPAVGLGNGYYLLSQYFYDGASTYYTTNSVLTTNPATAAASGGSLSNGKTLLAVAASTGVQDGAVAIIGQDVLSTGNYFHTYTATPSSGISTTVRDSAYVGGTPVGMVYGLGKFWFVDAQTASAARVFSIDPATPTVLNFVTTISTSNTAVALSFINGRLCVYVNNVSSLAPVVHTSTDGINWATLPIQNAAQNTFATGPVFSRQASSASMAISFTALGQVVSSTDADNWYAIPQNFLNIQSTNGNIIAQNSSTNGNTPTRYLGAFQITNPTIVTGYTQVNQRAPAQAITSLPNFVAFSNGSYFFTGGANTGIMTSLSGSIVTGSVSSTAINGQIFLDAVQGSYAIASAGSGMVIADARPSSGSTWSLGWVPDINVARSVAACSASILEIS